MTKKNPRQPNNSKKARDARQECFEEIERIRREQVDPDYEYTSEDFKTLFEALGILKNKASELNYEFFLIEEKLKKQTLRQKSEMEIE